MAGESHGLAERDICYTSHSLSKVLMVLSSHKLLLKAFKSDLAESFCEKITGLRFGRDLDKFDFARADVFAKPIIFYGIMIGARCHLALVKKALIQGPSIIFMYFDVKIDAAFELKFQSKAKSSGRGSNPKNVIFSNGPKIISECSNPLK